MAEITTNGQQNGNGQQSNQQNGQQNGNGQQNTNNNPQNGQQNANNNQQSQNPSTTGQNSDIQTLLSGLLNKSNGENNSTEKAMTSLLEKLGVKDETELNALIAEEKEKFLLMESKIVALQLGVNPSLVDDVVQIAKSRVSAEKDITKVLTDMKANEHERIFFSDTQAQNQQNGQQNGKRTVTSVQYNGNNNNNSQNGNNNNGGNTGNGSLAERLLQSNPKQEHRFYKN